MACRTRLSPNFGTSVRMCSCRCAADRILSSFTSGSFSSPWAPCTTTLQDNVHLAALQRDDLRLLVGVERELRAGRQRLAPPVVRVAHEARAHLGCVAFELERPGADERLLEVAGVVGRQDDRVVVVGRDDVGEVAVRGVEVELHREVVHLARAARRQDAAERRQCVGAVLRVAQAVHGCHHVGRVQHVAVVELHAGAQLERPDGSVGAARPGQRQHRAQHQVRLVEDQELAGLHQHHEAAGVGDGHRLDGTRRRRRRDADRGVALAGLRHRAACAKRVRGAEQPAQQRQRQAGPAPFTQQGAPVEVPGQELVNDMILKGRWLRGAGCPGTSGSDALCLLNPARRVVHGSIALSVPSIVNMLQAGNRGSLGR